MVTVNSCNYYLNVNSPPCTITIVGICRSAHENVTVIVNNNSEHCLPRTRALDLFYVVVFLDLFYVVVFLS